MVCLITVVITKKKFKQCCEHGRPQNNFAEGASPKEATQKDKKGPTQGEKVAKMPSIGRRTWQKVM